MAIKMKRVLFQGDSITDAGRCKENSSNMGGGYPIHVAAELGMDYPNEYEFFNLGISGNRSIDLLARVKADIINLKPDIMSILIGVNDAWHELEQQNGVDVEKYELYYNMLIEQVKSALPDIKIMILEPFLLKGTGTEKYWEAFRSEVEQRAAAAKRIAEKHGLPFIPLLEKFDKVDSLAPSGYWLADGVHPTNAGHELIAREWVKEFKKL